LGEVDYTVVPLFSTPLFVKEYLEISDDEKEYIKSFDYERMISNNGDYTKDKYVLNNPKLNKLNSRIIECVKQFVFEELRVSSDVQFYITNSWAVKHLKGDWAQPHVHTNSIFSGVCYLDVDDNSGDLSFHKEGRTNSVFPINLDLEVSTYNVLNSKIWKFTPKNNQLFIFPPWLLHGVDENKSDKERYSLAFNVYIKGKIGIQEFQLEIK